MVQTKPASAAKPEKNLGLRNGRQGFCKKFTDGLAGITLMLTSCLALNAEESVVFNRFQLQGVHPEQHSFSSGPASYVLTLSAEPSFTSEQPLHLLETFNLSS